MARLVEDHGALTLNQTLQPAIRLAREGFTMYGGMYDSILASRGKLGRFDATRALFLNEDGTAPRVAVGDLFTNPDLAHTLDTIARGGRAAFYTEGSLPEEIAAASRNAVNTNTGRRCNMYDTLCCYCFCST